MPAFLAGSFCAVVWCLLSQQLYCSGVRSRSMPECLTVTFLIIAPLTAALIFLFSSMRMLDELLLFLMSAVLIFVLYFFGQMCRTEKKRVSKLWGSLLICCILAILTVTLFTRDRTRNTDVLLSFGKLAAFLRDGSTEEIGHVLLNILMLMPFGFTLSASVPGKTDRLMVNLGAGLFMTATIESTQYLFRIGQCDLEDIVANTLGAVLGYCCYRLFDRCGGRNKQ